MKKSVFWIVLLFTVLIVSIAGAQRPQRRGVMMEPSYQTLASSLGMSAEQFRNNRRGRTLAELAKEKGLSEAELKQQVLKRRKAQVEQQLKEGKITKEQADYCLENMEQRIFTKEGPKGYRGGGRCRGLNFSAK